MSRMTVFVCDTCGSDDAARVPITVGSLRFTADLCSECIDNLVRILRDNLPELVESKKASSSIDAKAIRTWAAEQGMQVSARGRIGLELRAAYDDFMARGTVAAATSGSEDSDDEGDDV